MLMAQPYLLQMATVSIGSGEPPRQLSRAEPPAAHIVPIQPTTGPLKQPKGERICKECKQVVGED